MRSPCGAVTPFDYESPRIPRGCSVHRSINEMGHLVSRKSLDWAWGVCSMKPAGRLSVARDRLGVLMLMRGLAGRMIILCGSGGRMEEAGGADGAK